jgi:hypothetical protein
MIDRLVALIVDESKWLAASMGLALCAVTMLLYRHRHSHLTTRRRTLAAMNLFFAVTVGTMALGHLLAVTTKLAWGTLQGPVPVFYAIGIALAVPSWWLVRHAWGLFTTGEHPGRVTVVLNAWLALTLLALGVHNLPLAVPALFNIAYHLHSGRVTGRAIVGLAVVVNAGLFVGSLLFLARGQSFEQFSGIEDTRSGQTSE